MLGDDRTNGLSTSLGAGTPIFRDPLSESRMDLGRLGIIGEGKETAAAVAVGVGGRDIVWCLFKGGG